MRDRLLNTSEIGELLGIQRTTVTKYIRNGKIKDTTKLGKQYYLSYSSLCNQFNLNANQPAKTDLLDNIKTRQNVGNNWWS